MPLDRLLADEQIWREVPDPERGDDARRVVIGHWTDARTEERKLVAPVFEGHYTVSILPGTATVDCYKDECLRGKGTGGIGGIQLTAPGERVLCGFRGPNEAVHLFFPQAVVESEYESVRQHDAPLRLEDPAFRCRASGATDGRRERAGDTTRRPRSRRAVRFRARSRSRRDRRSCRARC